MKLTELVSYFRNGGTYKDFCQKYALNFESEVIEVYMKKPINIDQNLFFFEIEKTGSKIEFILNNEIYFNITDFYFFQDFIEESNSKDNLSLPDELIAQQFLSYIINDA